MLIAVLLFAGCQTLVLACFSIVAVRWYNRERSLIENRLSDTMRAFFEAPNADTPSPLAVLVDQFALLFAARLSQQIKAMLSGVESGESKGQQMALINEATSSNPLLAILSSMLPKRIRNRLLSNPQMIGALSKLGSNHQGESSAETTPRRHRD